MTIIKENIQLQVNERTAAAYLAAPQDGGPGVLVLHAWWGLKPFFKQVCDRLAEKGFVALAPDLNNGEIAGTIEAANELLNRNDENFIYSIVKAAKDHLLTTPANKGAQLGVLGFSMGGAWSLVSATEWTETFAAAVVFYGAGGADFTKMKAKFLGHFSDADEWEPLEGVREMEAAMKTAGVQATLHIYPGASHWFVEDDRPEYEPALAKLAWDRTYDFLKENL